MHYLWRDYFFDAFAVKIEQIAEPYIVHLFVAIGNNLVELTAKELPSSHANHLAEARANLIYDKFAVALVV